MKWMKADKKDEIGWKWHLKEHPLLRAISQIHFLRCKYAKDRIHQLMAVGPQIWCKECLEFLMYFYKISNTNANENTYLILKHVHYILNQISVNTYKLQILYWVKRTRWDDPMSKFGSGERKFQFVDLVLMISLISCSYLSDSLFFLEAK